MHVWSLALRLRLVTSVLALLALVGACGGGGSTNTTTFLFAAIGPAGGTLAAGPATVAIPPGALLQTTGVSLLPQATPLPIQAAPGDPCTYSYVGPIYCCGPVGQALLVNGTLRMTYDEALIPAGFTEQNLVLLEWDNVAGVMRPVPSPPAFQDTVQNFFEDPAYGELGHIAIGLRDCTRAAGLGNLVVQNGQPLRPPLTAGGAQARQQAPPVATLHLVDMANPGAPVLIPTFGLPIEGFVPSPSRQRILVSDRDVVNGGTFLHTVRVDGVGGPVLIASDDAANGVFVQSSDPLFGWLAQGPDDTAYYAQYVAPAAGAKPRGSVSMDPPQRYELWRRLGTAATPAVRMHVTDASFSFLDDLRQSADGSHVMVYSFAFTQAPSFVDVIQPPSGAPASLGVVPPSTGPQSPRFDPTSDALTLPDTLGQEANRYTPAGAFVDTLLTLFVMEASPTDQIQDFALAPDGDAFAAVVDLDSKGLVSELWMGTLSGGVEATYFFGQQVFVNEMIWHPQQTGVFLDLSGLGVALYSIRTDDGTYIGTNFVPANTLSDVDVNRVDGRIVALQTSFFLDATGQAARLADGLYISPPDASDWQPLVPAGLDSIVKARWLATWRYAPGRSSSRVR